MLDKTQQAEILKAFGNAFTLAYAAEQIDDGPTRHNAMKAAQELKEFVSEAYDRMIELKRMKLGFAPLPADEAEWGLDDVVSLTPEAMAQDREHSSDRSEAIPESVAAWIAENRVC